MNDAIGIIIKTYGSKSQYLYLKGVLNKIGAAHKRWRRFSLIHPSSINTAVSNHKF